MAYIISVCIILLIGAALIAFLFWLNGPERVVQQADYTPEGLRVILVDLPGDPNLITFKSPELTDQSVHAFIKAYCGHSTIFTPKPSTWFDRLRGEQRATFTC